MRSARWWPAGAAVLALATGGSLVALPTAFAGAAPPGAAPPGAAVSDAGGPLVVRGATVSPLAAPSAAAGPATTRSPAIAGYGVKATTVTSVSGAFVVPTLACPSTGTAANQISLQIDGGVSGGTFVTVGCQSGVATYSAKAFVVGGTTKLFAVTPGARVTTTMTVTTSGGTATLTVHAAVAHGTRTSASGSAATGPDTHAWAVYTDATGPVAPFGTLRWSGVRVDTAPLAAALPTRFVLVTGKVTLVGTGKLSATGLAFSNFFKAS